MKLLIDCRESEKTSKYVQEEAKKLDIETSVEMIPIGDYVCYEKSLCIERKSIEDFYGSIVSQRIFEQVKQMVQNYDNNYLVIAGTYKQLLSDPNMTNVSVHVMLGAMASLASKYKITTLVVENEKQLGYLIVKIAEKQGEVAELNITRRLQFSSEDAKVAALTAPRGISSEKAKRLLQRFGTLSKVCSASVEELQEVEGIGGKTAQNIKEIFY